MEKKCCKIILEHANKLKVGKEKEVNASSLVAVVNSWKLLPNKCEKCIEREKLIQNSIKRIQNSRGYEYEF